MIARLLDRYWKLRNRHRLALDEPGAPPGYLRDLLDDRTPCLVHVPSHRLGDEGR